MLNVATGDHSGRVGGVQSVVLPFVTADGGAGQNTFELVPQANTGPWSFIIASGPPGHAFVNGVNLVNFQFLEIHGSGQTMIASVNHKPTVVGDTINVGDLVASGVKVVDVELAAPSPAITPDTVNIQIATASQASVGDDGAVEVRRLDGLGLITIHDLDSTDTLVLGNGDDLIDFSLSPSFGVVNGGGGNDTIIGQEKGGGVIHGGGGSDKITAGAAAAVFGDAGVNTIQAGDHTIFKSMKSDDGTQIISGFRSHLDGGDNTIHLWFYLDTSFNDLISHNHIFQQGNDVFITAGGTTPIVELLNVDIHRLTAADFLFDGTGSI